MDQAARFADGQCMANTITTATRRPFIVRPHERLALAGVAVSARLSSRSLRLFLFGARHGGGALELVSAPSAVAAVTRAYRAVPAYRAFLDQHGGLPRRRLGCSASDWVASLPVTSKHSYVDAYPVAERCAG